MNIDSKTLGRHIVGLRKVRRLTQEDLAERSGLSTDTIRRLEHGSFSPGLATLKKLCVGLDLLMSTFFEAVELGERYERHELDDLLSTRSPSELAMVARMLRSLFDDLDANADESDD